MSSVRNEIAHVRTWIDERFSKCPTSEALLEQAPALIALFEVIDLLVNAELRLIAESKTEKEKVVLARPFDDDEDDDLDDELDDLDDEDDEDEWDLDDDDDDDDDDDTDLEWGF